MPAPRRSKTDREGQRDEAARLERRGHTTREIAAALGVSQSQVMYDLKLVRKRYADSQVESRAALVAEKVEQYRELRREAWEAWERSKRNAVKRVEKDVVLREESKEPAAEGEAKPPEKVTPLERTTTRERQSGDPRFLQTVLSCLAAERELRGLDAPKEFGVNHTLTWDDVMAQAPASVPDRAGEEIAKAENQIDG